MATHNPDELSQQEQADIWAAYIAERLAAGHSRTAVQMTLVDQGFASPDAAAFISNWTA